jgi:methyltransferase (TIGR00027 family)
MPMPADDRLVRDISDTAYWVAYYRAMETDRPDAVFRDPHARALAGERGERIAKTQKLSHRNAWSFMARTYLFDRFLSEEVRAGADLVVNLAAGLDTRPYRMDLPKALRWVEVDLPGILDYKENVLRGAAPVCFLERVRLDLADETARRALFARLAGEARRAVIVTEGLIIYLKDAQVASLARDLAAPPPFRTWLTDLASPGLVKMLQRGRGQIVAAAGSPFVFAPPEGAEFFPPLGWRPAETSSLLKTAAGLRRLPLFLSLIARLPEPKKRDPNRPWSAVVKLVRDEASTVA